MPYNLHNHFAYSVLLLYHCCNASARRLRLRCLRCALYTYCNVVMLSSWTCNSTRSVQINTCKIRQSHTSECTANRVRRPVAKLRYLDYFTWHHPRLCNNLVTLPFRLPPEPFPYPPVVPSNALILSFPTLLDRHHQVSHSPLLRPSKRQHLKRPTITYDTIPCDKLHIPPVIQ